IEVSGEMEEMFLADVSGKILQRFDIKNHNIFRISLAQYPAGIYFIQYQNGERWKTGKVIHINRI
ncbi:MAG: T9SS type A sorting domain-containing protein, partial [Bacteroidales bacterium]|nr:T9SS type A sorting domain-containing protein [Bacteroidales bacterium]